MNPRILIINIRSEVSYVAAMLDHHLYFIRLKYTNILQFFCSIEHWSVYY